MKKECVAMLLAGGQGSRLYVLTGSMAKPAVPFGGKFRIIDFPLSNCTNSGIDTVGVLTQYRPLELNSYIGSGQPWELDRVNGGVHILPPYQSAGGAVWLNREQLPDWDYWQFWRNVDDRDVGKFLRLFTDMPDAEIARLEALEGAEINDAKIALANAATLVVFIATMLGSVIRGSRQAPGRSGRRRAR